MEVVNGATSLASAMAAATLASQHAYAATTSTAAVRYAFSGGPMQAWDSPLLRVAELISTGYPAWQAPPLFLPKLTSAATGYAVLSNAPQPIQVSGMPINTPVKAEPFNGEMSGYCPPAVSEPPCTVPPMDYMAAAVEGALLTAIASPMHAEPQTPDLNPVSLRLPSLPVPGSVPSPAATISCADARQLQTVVTRPIAIRAVRQLSATGPLFAAGSPLAAARSPPSPPSDSPPSIHSAGAAFYLVQPTATQPSSLPVQLHTAAAEAPRVLGPSAATAMIIPSIPMAVPLTKPVALKLPPAVGSPRSTTARKRRGPGPGSPVKRRAGSPDSVTEGCGDSMEIHEEALERATGYKGRFCGRLFLKEDEKRLAVECEALGPLVGFPGPGKRGHCTVAKLARSIVAGSVRHIFERRFAEVQALQQQLAELRAQEEARTLQMARENDALRHELSMYKAFIGNTAVSHLEAGRS